MKRDDERIAFPEENVDGVSVYGYYLISRTWMHKWRNFVSQSGGRPGPVDNTELIETIEAKRKQLGYPSDELELNLNDKTDYYILSTGFFKFYYDLYDAKNILIIKYTTRSEAKELNGDVFKTADYP